MYTTLGSAPRIGGAIKFPLTPDEKDNLCSDSAFVSEQLAKKGYAPPSSEEENNRNLIDYAQKRGLIKDPSSVTEEQLDAVCEELIAIHQGRSESPPEPPPASAPPADDDDEKYKRYAIYVGAGLLGVGVLSFLLGD